ncbi:transcriptional repressor [Streptomyces sp. Z38]|uniref:transcriptional repressor n=1 Tax=Streptomyces sp. Z38 TaxID=2682780 RepID=UPI001E3DEF97|nr:transcriptional repressor [Streptomyces sp. Z38]
MSALQQRAGFTSAQDLHEALEVDGITIGLTTVYRTLHALTAPGRSTSCARRAASGCTGPDPTTGTATVSSAANAASAPRSRRVRSRAGRRSSARSWASPKSSTRWN